MNPFKLLNPEYLFDITPGTHFHMFWPFMVLLILIFMGSFYLNKWIHHRPNPKISIKFLGGVPYRMREFALLGLVLAVFRAERVPVLGMRFWLALLCLSILIYGLVVWRNYELGFAEAVGNKKEKAAQDKYLPKKKRKKSKKR